MWNIVIKTNAKKQRRVYSLYSNLLIAVEVGAFCLFLDKNYKYFAFTIFSTNDKMTLKLEEK
jgi:hypothetical protein